MIGELIISNNIKLVKAVSKYRLLKKFDNLNEEGSIVFRNMKTGDVYLFLKSIPDLEQLVIIDYYQRLIAAINQQITNRGEAISDPILAE